jgi:hypothetical protein
LKRRVVGLLILGFAMGCGIHITPRVSGTGIAPIVPGASSRTTVLYEVRCQSCTVSYLGEEGNQTEEMEGVWSRRVRLEAAGGGRAWLEASPMGNGTWVESARIHVGGRLRASFQEGQGGHRRGETVVISAPLT